MKTLEEIRDIIVKQIKDYECIYGIYENDDEFIFDIAMLQKYQLPNELNGGYAIVVNKTDGKYNYDTYFSLAMQDRLHNKIA